VLAEEWQTAEALSRFADLVRSDATLGRPLLVWNCNHPLCLDRVDWARLKARSAITTVSRYMRGRLLERGVDARVVPNGIPASMLLPAPEAQTAALTHVFGDRLSLVKVGRWDPNKGWLQAVDAGAQLRHAGVPVRLLLRGGAEPYGREVLDRCRAHGLAVREVAVDDPDPFAMVAAVAAHAEADVLNLRFRLTDAHKRLLFGAGDAVVANSVMEPFGLVGLETMAAGGVAVVGTTGEDYANQENALRLPSGTAEELAIRAQALLRDPGLTQRIRAAGRRTARDFVWERVLQTTLLPMIAPDRAVSGATPRPAVHRSQRALTSVA